MDKQVQMAFFYDIFDPSLPRLGPGDDASTHKALKTLIGVLPKMPVDPKQPNILDIGCGNGAQTISLAKRLPDGTILAVDNHQPFLTELVRRAKSEGVSDIIRPYLRDMNDMGLEKRSFDLIWSEGALYNMGFGHGLGLCHSLLVPGGALAVSELCWLKSDPPAECRDFFAGEYPAMQEIGSNLDMFETRGYDHLGHFTLPESAWWESYYTPLAGRLETFGKKYAGDPERLDIIGTIQMEIDLYRKYSSYYGYVFYLMQRPSDHQSSG